MVRLAAEQLGRGLRQELLLGRVIADGHGHPAVSASVDTDKDATRHRRPQEGHEEYSENSVGRMAFHFR